MCGIAGLIGYSGDMAAQIRNMNRQMIRRGPDAGDLWIDENRKVALGHRRLSIVDLSENGAQPMHSADGRYVLVYNGETYNFRELRDGLAMDGSWRGTSDTEVILAAFSHYGVEKTLRMMKGMFALALYDRQEETLILARDRAGEKPLYYGISGGCFVFASDPSAVKAFSGFDTALAAAVLPLYFQYGYIPTPYTIYRDLYKLEPGTWLEVKAHSLEIKQYTYWSMKEAAKYGEEHLFAGTRREAADRLEELLKDAVKGQMISDVPLGAFLSGGIDSSLVVSIMQSVSSVPVRTFTIGFDEEEYNEAVYAKEIAAHLGTDHTELYVSRQEACDIIPELARCYAEPFADSSQIPTMLLSKMTREHVTVSLSGDAGDELFCGYNTYRIAEEGLKSLKRKYHRLPGGMRRAAGKACSFLEGKNNVLHKAGAYLTMETLEDAHRYIGLEDIRTKTLSKDKTQLMDAYHAYEDGYLKEGVQNLMLMDLLQYLPDDILVKVDRGGAHYSLETRMPLLDRDIMEFAWTLPLSYKFSDGESKRVMRDVLYRYVPKETMERPKKGFSVPLGAWLKEGALREWAEGLLHDGASRYAELVDRRTVRSYWNDYLQKNMWSEKIWYILILYQWLDENHKKM